jgi:hypothetical protein
MSIINGVGMPNFTHKEIPPATAKFMDPQILRNIQKYRGKLGHSFSISKAVGALIRFDGSTTSQHHVTHKMPSGKAGKRSKAIDGFPDCDIFEAWSKALSSNLFTGVGVYFDTNNNHGEPQPMLHLDLRPSVLIWFRDEGEYFYPHKDKDFFKRLFHSFKYANLIC